MCILFSPFNISPTRTVCNGLIVHELTSFLTGIIRTISRRIIPRKIAHFIL